MCSPACRPRCGALDVDPAGYKSRTPWYSLPHRKELSMSLRQRVARSPLIVLVAIVLGLGIAPLGLRGGVVWDYGDFLASGWGLVKGMNPYSAETLGRWVAITGLQPTGTSSDLPNLLTSFCLALADATPIFVLAVASIHCLLLCNPASHSLSPLPTLSHVVVVGCLICRCLAHVGTRTDYCSPRTGDGRGLVIVASPPRHSRSADWRTSRS